MNQRELQLRIGQRLRERRETQGVTRERLEDQSGLSARFIGSIERGESLPSLKTLLRLANALKIDPSEFLQSPNLSLPRRPDKRERLLQRLIAWVLEADIKSVELLLRLAQAVKKN